MEDANQLLQQLHDIELPGDGGLPIAPGWIVLLLLGLCLVLYAIKRLRRKPELPGTDTNWQTPAITELDQIRARFNTGDTSTVLADSSRLARRITIARTQRSDVAGLTGQSWLEKLDELSTSDFYTQGSGRLLESAPYQKSVAVDDQQLDQILEAMEQLIKSVQGAPQ